jgi:phage baseplate assembly protein V
MSASTEHDRQLGNLVMLGVIKELDEANALVRVDVDGLVTDWIPFTAARAGAGVREWLPPEVGEQVVMLSPYGDPAQGVVLGSVYQDAHAAPANVKTTKRTEFADGAFIQYDREGHKYDIDVPAGGAITLRIGQTTLKLEDGQATLTTPKCVVDSPDSQFTGNVTIDGDATVNGSTAVKAITSNGKSISDTHKHTGVQTGGGVSGPVQ